MDQPGCVADRDWSARVTGVQSIVRFRDSDLVVRCSGAGVSVGYLHGPLGALSGNPFLAALAALGGVASIAPELPGFGGSPECGDLRGIYDWVVATSEIVDACGLAGRTVVASSLGAMLALEVAAVRPGAFEHLILIGPLGLWDEDEPVADTLGVTLRQQRDLYTANAGATAAFFDDDDGLPVAEQVNQRVERYVARATGASLTWPIPDFGLDTRIHRVTCPVTLIWGRDDRVVPLSYLDRFAACLPNVNATHVIDGAGHLVEWDRPGEVATIVADVVG